MNFKDNNKKYKINLDNIHSILISDIAKIHTIDKNQFISNIRNFYYNNNNLYRLKRFMNIKNIIKTNDYYCYFGEYQLPNTCNKVKENNFIIESNETKGYSSSPIYSIFGMEPGISKFERSSIRFFDTIRNNNEIEPMEPLKEEEWNTYDG